MIFVPKLMRTRPLGGVFDRLALIRPTLPRPPSTGHRYVHWLFPNHILHHLALSTPRESMARRAAQKPKPTVTGEVIPPTTHQTGTKDSPILLLSDEENEGSVRPLDVTAVPQKRHLGVSPSDTHTSKGQGSAYYMMIAMGYKPDSGLGPNLRGSANSRSVSGVSGACLSSPRESPTLAG